MSSSAGSKDDATRWIVIPKGIDRARGVLTVTLQWVPKSDFDILNCGWPRIAKTTALSIKLRTTDRKATQTWTYADKVCPWQDGINEQLWNAVFTPPRPPMPVDRSKIKMSGTPSAQKQMMAWETARLSKYLSQIAAGMLDGHLSSARQAADAKRSHTASLSAMMPTVWARALMKDATQDGRPQTPPSGLNHQVLCNAFGTVLKLYMPSAPSAHDVAQYLDKKNKLGKILRSSDKPGILSQLRHAYLHTVEDDPDDKEATPRDQTWQARLAQQGSAGLALTTLTNLAADISWRMQQNAATVREADNNTAIFFEALAGMTPWRSQYANSLRDDESPQPLAGIGQSFTLQTQLGMIRDFELHLGYWSDGAQQALLSRETLHISAAPAFLVDSDPSPARAWTVMDGERYPHDKDAHTDDPQLGLLPLDGAHFTMLELRQSMQRFVMTSQQVRGTLDFQSQAPQDADNDTPFAPGFKSGPLQLLRKGVAQKTVRLRRNAQVKKFDDPGEAVFCLQDLTIGIRPDLQIAYPGRPDASPWRPLLGRKLSYSFKAEELEATAGDRHAGRMEGYIPLTRMSSSLHDALTVEDELFAWHGWNPALPVAGKKASTATGTVPLPKILPILGSNPAFRYGSRVWARARIVLRDGSSLPSPSLDTPIPPGYIAAGDALTTKNNGFPIKRYEPLRAPALLLGESPSSSAWLPPESLEHVILGSCQRFASLSRDRSVRYWLPGAIRDISEVERHGAFDSGLTPNATAFPHYARGEQDFETVPAAANPYPALPESATPASAASAAIPASSPPSSSTAPAPPARLPIFRLGKAPYKVPLPYYPDPLVRGLVLSLARKSKSGQWLPVVDNDRSLCWVHPFYSVQRVWPDAIALRIEVSGDGAGTQTACRYTPPALEGEARLNVRVPPGEQVWLVAWPYCDPQRLGDAHAFGALAAHWDPFVEAESKLGMPFEFPQKGVSGLISETSALLIDHYVDVPDAPSLEPELAGTALKRAALSTQQPFALRAGVTPGSTTGIDVIARWTDPLDDAGTPQPTYPRSIDKLAPGVPGLKQAPVCVMTSALIVAADAALFDRSVNKLLRPPITVPGDGTQNGTFAVPDTRHRYVRYIPIAHSRVPRPGGGPLEDDALRTREGQGITVNVLASASPQVPVVRDVLPAFSFQRSHHSNSARSCRMTAVTLMIERGWWSSGPGELLAVKVADADATHAAQDDARQKRSAWGGDPALSLFGKIHNPLRSVDFGQTSQRVAPEDAKQATDGKAPENVVLFQPEFDAREQCWRVDILLHTPEGVAQPFLQLAVTRYQPNAIAGMNFSEVVLTDFIQLQDIRFATIVPDPQDATKFRITVSGPIVDGHVEPVCVSRRLCSAKADYAGHGFRHARTCCITRRRGIEAWLEFAPRWDGTSPLWKQHTPSVFLDAELNGDSFTWSGELTEQQRLELPTRRIRVCLVERGLFQRDPVVDDVRRFRHGPLYYLEQLEFTEVEYNGDDHP